MLLKKIDIYIIKKFLLTLFFSIITIISIAIVFDFAERLEDFLKQNLTIYQVLTQYYVYFSPYFANLFLPLFIFISVIFFTSKMALHSELIAIFTSGISFVRFLVPYIISSIFLALTGILLSNFIVPHATKKKLDFEYKYIRNPYKNLNMHIHRQISPGVILYVESYSVDNNIAYKLSVEKFKEKKLISKLYSDFAKWDSTQKKWKIFNCYIRTFTEDSSQILFYPIIDTALSFYPTMFNQRAEVIEAYDYYQLKKFIEKKILEGDENLNYYYVVLYKRFILPLSSIVLTLIGVSVSYKKRREGIGFYIGLGIALAFSYILLMQIFVNLSINANLQPLIGVSFPTFAFLIISLILLKLLR